MHMCDPAGSNGPGSSDSDAALSLGVCMCMFSALCNLKQTLNTFNKKCRSTITADTFAVIKNITTQLYSQLMFFLYLGTQHITAVVLHLKSF